jgi:pSer/pThr/pTyr-binding forkhead associated (FHA) protein/outer membrane biosynthesis protein TonB
MADASQITLHFKVYRGEELLLEAVHSEPSISIGRADSALLKIDDPSVGELHAVINVEDDGTVQLLDLGTAAGTLVAGERISNADLSPGDRFTVGDLEIVLRFDEAEGATPTMDVRPSEVGVAAAVDSAGAAGDDTVGDPIHAMDSEDVLEMVMRSGTGTSNAGIDIKAPKVLEVNQIWSNVLLDTRHYARGANVRIGSSVGWRWSLLGVQLGWVPSSAVAVLSVSPPMWSEVVSDWRNDFYTSDDSLPGGLDFDLFSWTGSNFVAKVDTRWDGFADVGEQRFTFEELVTAGKAQKTGNFYEIPVTEDLRLAIDIDGVIFFSHMVAAGKRVLASATDNLDYPFLGIFAFCAFVGAMFGLVMAFSPPRPENEMVEIPDRFVEIMLDRPEPEKKEAKKPEANPDAGEGEKAKKEEGKVGKKDAKMKKAKGNKKEVAKTQRDREIAENAGVLGALDDAGAMDGVFGSSGLDANLTGGIGGLIGAKGVQIGAGGLGSRGSGLGGGGSAEGLGGLGTRGVGSGRSGFGSGGGSFGAKGEGRVSATSGDPLILGALDRSLIDQVIKAKMAQIRYCYQRELQKDPSLGGKIVIKFTIAKDGTVSKASVKTTSINNSAVEQCVVGRFYKMQFPEPKGGGIVIVSYPFIFSGG